jgi:hypothetical protein
MTAKILNFCHEVRAREKISTVIFHQQQQQSSETLLLLPPLIEIELRMMLA